MPQYNVEYKQEVVKYYEKYGQKATVSKYGHNHSVIHRWKRKSETVGFMRKQRKTYSVDEKLEILKYYWENGVMGTERKYDINNAVLFKWERRYMEYGIKGLEYDGRGRPPKSLGSKKDVNKDLDLLAENQRLRMELDYLKKLDALVQEREEREQKKKRK